MNALVACSRLPFTGPEWRLAFGTIDAPEGDLVESELARGFSYDRFGNDAIPCKPPGALCALRGGVLVITVAPRQRMACG
jgi:hypothetical protein